MSRRQGSEERPDYSPPNRGRRGGDPLGVVTLVGVTALLMISFSNWREIDRIDRTLDERLGKLDTRMGQVAEKVDKLPAQAGPTRQGPDPNRVYAIRTAGAPARGPALAPVVIAEFSDFQ